MYNGEPANIQPEMNNSARRCTQDISSGDNVSEKLEKLTVTRNNSPYKGEGEGKVRERHVKIARGHQMIKNIESALNDARCEKKSLKQGRREQQYERKLEVEQTALPASHGSEMRRQWCEITVEELIQLFDLAANDQRIMNDKLSRPFGVQPDKPSLEQALKILQQRGDIPHVKLTERTLNDGNLTLNEEDWNRFASHVANVGVHEARGFAVGVAVMAAGHENFRSSFAQEINVLMSNYVLFERKTEEGIPELVALLLVANWPREHARSDIESNAVLFYIISSIKGWLITITGEADENEEVESNCACALYEVCRFAQRKLWMKWPELVDECYAAVRDAITSNITLNKEARKALLDTMIMMHEWTSRNAKTLVNASTQTHRTRV